MHWNWKTTRLVKPNGGLLTRGVNLTAVLLHYCPLDCEYCPNLAAAERHKRGNHKTSSLEEWKEFFRNFPHFPSLVNLSGGEPSTLLWISDLANWLADRGTHVIIYSMLWVPENLLGLKKSCKMEISATYHHGDDKERFLRAYNMLKDKVRVTPRELSHEKDFVFDFTVAKPFCTQEEHRDYIQIHLAPDSPKTKKMYIGCYPIYHEGRLKHC